MRKFLLGALALLITGSAFAQVMEPEEALDRAMSKLLSGAIAARKSRAARISRKSIRLSHTETNGTEQPLFYVYDMAGGGFLMAGADERSSALLGYADGTSFEDMKSNPAFMGWLSSCTDALKWLSGQPVKAARAKVAAATLTKSVEPLLKSKWGQDEPYNNLCPFRTDTIQDTTKRAPSGCTCTATAQVMYYYKWPLRGKGYHTNVNEPDKTVWFDESVYDWEHMKDSYNDNTDSVAASAVAKLMYDVGCAVNMCYGFKESGAKPDSAFIALVDYFGYDKSARYERRTYFSSADWNTLLRDELDNRRPLIYAGWNSNGDGHAYVIDGYDTNGLFHVNWGWMGDSDSYFDINFLNPEKQGTGGSSYEGGYNISQAAIVNLKKDSLGTSVGQPRLLVSNRISYDSTDNIFKFSPANIGTADFTGYAGLALIDPNDGNKVIDYSEHSFANVPLHRLDDENLNYTIPEKITVKPGYIVKPYWRLTADEKMEDLPCYTSAEKYLTASLNDDDEIEWKYDYNTELPDLLFSDLKITRSYVGYSPRFKLTVSNSADSQVEYNERITAKVYSGDSIFCKGETQCFIMPGKSSVIEIDCVEKWDVGDTLTYDSLKAGKYMYEIQFQRGDESYILYDGKKYAEGSITMMEPDSCIISGTDFALDKYEIFEGDTLTASCTLTNTGGYIVCSFNFSLYKPDSLNAEQIIETDSPYEMITNKAVHVEMKDAVNLAPGEYVGYFYNNNDNICIDDTKLLLTVKERPAGIEDITSTAATKPDVIYDLCGRRVRNVSGRGVYIIGGRKVIR